MIPQPSNYKLKFDIDFTNSEYKCFEEIKLSVDQKCNAILLDSVDLEIRNCTLDGNQLEWKLKDNQLSISNNFQPDQEYTLIIDFVGKISDGLAGFYKGKYSTADGEKYIATTQFEAADARRAFPCVDHPNYKATFDIEYLIDKNHIGISNTLPIEEKEVEGKKYIKFATSPLMSTYLVYLGVGDFEIYEDKYNDVVVRGITIPGKSQYTEFSVECTKKVLQYFEEYFGEKYPLPKVDLIAVPDFAAGAMENWGAITFRETAVLFYPESTSIVRKNLIAEVVAHELAHQWFGNLVTMKWWSDLWLNESFATFMAIKALDKIWPEWNVWTQYVSDTVFAGMELDKMKSSHPIQVTVNKAEEIDELFDAIAYEKGGSVLRMLEEYLGEDVFTKGIQKYIQENKYSNAEGKNLWETLEQVSNKPVSKLMISLTTQTGFPLINVELKDQKLYISQKRFEILNSTEVSTQTWIQPMVLTDGNKTERIVLRNAEENLDLFKDSDFIIANKNYSGFYITNYSTELLTSIGNNWSKVSQKEKMGILHDLYNLSIATKIKIQDYTDFIEKYLLNETDDAVMNYCVQSLYQINLRLNKSDVEQILIKTAKQGIKISGLAPKEDESPIMAQLRMTSLLSLTFYKDKDSLEFVKDNFEKYLIDENSLHPSIQAQIVGLAVLSDNNNYKTAKDLYFKADNEEKKAKIFQALGNVQDPELLKDGLNMCLSDDVRLANLYYIFKTAGENLPNKKIVFDWINSNWKEMANRSAGMGVILLKRLLDFTFPVIGIDRIEDVKAFLDNNKSELLTKSFEQIYEETLINSNFVKNNQ